MAKLPRTIIFSPNSIDGARGASVMARNLFRRWEAETVASVSTVAEPLARVSAHPKYAFPPMSTIWNLPWRWLRYMGGRSISVDGVMTFRPTRSFARWVHDFCPQVVYCQLGPPMLLRAALWVAETRSIPLVSHVMDDFAPDWPVNGHRLRRLIPFNRTLNRILSQDLEAVLRRSGYRACISDAMAQVYRERYDLPFDGVSNPIDMVRWESADVSREMSEEELTLTFTGSVSENTNSASLLQMARIAREISGKVKVSLRIFTHRMSKRLRSALERYGVNVCPAVSHDEVPEILRRSDGLVLPFNFDAPSRRFFDLSWPTKLTEYAATGTPILYYGPDTPGFARELADRRAAIICHDAGALQDVLLHWKKRVFEYSEVSSRAQDWVRCEHDVERVSRAWEREFLALMEYE